MTIVSIAKVMKCRHVQEWRVYHHNDSGHGCRYDDIVRESISMLNEATSDFFEFGA